jgi:putative membrane protein
MSDQNVQQNDQNQITTELKTTDILAYERTILAQERTLMASIRTSVSLISFGFTIAKFFQDLKTSEVMKGISNISSRNVGFWLVFIGTAYIFLFSIQHQFILHSLRVKGVQKRISYTFILAIVIGLLGLALILSFYSDIFSLGLNK